MAEINLRSKETTRYLPQSKDVTYHSKKQTQGELDVVDVIIMLTVCHE